MPEPIAINWITVALSFFGGGLIGSTVSVIASHCFTTKRDKLGRLNHFRGQLSRWRCHFYRENDPVSFYRNITGDIAYECGMILPDLPELKTTFWKFYSLNADELAPADGKNGRDVLISHVESIMELVGAHPTA